MSDFLKNRTIAQHARILEAHVSNTLAGQQQQPSEWSTVHRTEGPASYAQERIWLDEQVRFDQHKASIAMYNLPFVFKLESGQLSIQRLRQALRLVISKHSTLRTALQFHDDCLWQHILSIDEQNFEFKESSILNDERLTSIVIDEETNRSLFNTEQGRTVRLHIVRQHSDNEMEDKLVSNDIIIFNFHHSAFDGSSIKPFFTDFADAYCNQKLAPFDSNAMTYLAYASYERSIDFTEDKQFWEKTLHGYDFTKHIALPYDHRECLTFSRSGRGKTISFELETQLIQSITHFTSETNVSLYQMFLAIYFVYLFKLAQNDPDLYVLSVVANRLHHELHSMVGMFVNTIPCRLQLDPHCPFDKFVVTVQHFLIKALAHSQLPYQQIVSSNSIAANTLFRFETREEYAASDIMSMIDNVCLSDAGSPNGDSSQVAMFDLILTVRYDSNNKHMKILFTYSKDLFEECTINTMAQRFRILLRQLFEQNLERQQPIFSLSLLLPNEVTLQQELNNTQLEYHDDNERQRAKNTIGQFFSQQAVNLSQKVAVDYVLCKRLLFPLGMSQMQDALFSSSYYRWWFLQRLWTLNTFWLSHISGTSFYNSYLRLCGARIGQHTIIDTTFIDAPDLLQIANSTYIGDEAVLSSLTYYDRTFKLHPIRIGSNCAIDCRTVLYNGVEMEERVLVKSMSPVTGYFSSGSIVDGPLKQIDKEWSNSKNNNHALSKPQNVFQLISILMMLFLHIFIVTFTCWCLSTKMPLFIRLAIVWLTWSTGRMIPCVVLLKFIVGEAQPGIYSLNSWYFLRKFWLRQLVVRSLAFSFVSNIGPYHLLFPRLLQWLGARIDEANDVRISQPHFLLAFPTNLVHIEQGTTVNGFVLFIPFTVTTDGLCKVNCIRLGRNAQFGNHCTIQQGANIAERTLVGTMTRINEETNTVIDNDSPGHVVLGIPARLMPFQRDIPISVSANKSSPYIYSDLASAICVQFLVKVIISFLFVHAYLLLPIYFLLAEHFISLFFFALPREICLLDRINRWRYQLSAILTLDFYTFIAPLLGGTQWLVILFRRLKANIGQDVIIGEINAIEDWKHVSLGSHVRVSATAKVQVRDT
ncbi:unnamed protein product [Rotaria sp. Silwood2]|nr:unnamed protein product [Rotaria sp. Silwood2]CAF4488070.1 unnamed protein product [Rotaria sp. Silwood2]